MKVVKKIRLIDGSEHNSIQQAERHLYNILSSGTDLELFERLANKSTLKVKEFFILNYNEIQKTMQIITELKEIDNLKNF